MPLTKEEAQAILEEVKVNLKRLAECEGPHNFVVDQNNVVLHKKRCTKCGGTLNRLDVIWYERGLEHGRKEK